MLRHTAKQRRDLHPVADINPGGTASDGVHARQMGGGALQGIHDLIEVPLWIGLGARVPRDFLAKNRLAILQRRDFAVTRPKIETNSAAIKVAAQRGSELPLGR